MVLLRKELKQSLKSFIIWTLIILSFMIMCIVIYPDIQKEMESVSELFASLGSFSKAFALDKLNFGTYIGYYAVEIGNILGLIGALYASVIGGSIISCEETDNTAELLYSSVVKRKSILTSKLLSSILLIVILNIICYVLPLITSVILVDSISIKDFTTLHLMNTILHIEVLCISFLLSSFYKKQSLFLSLGVSMGTYVLYIMANLSDSLSFLKYITPFSYTDGDTIINKHTINYISLIIGIIISFTSILVSYIYYSKKDIK